MVAELLAVWGVKAAWSAFSPILEDLAKDVAKDAAKGYVGKCFGSVFSAASREPLTKAVGRMVKELLDLLEYELGLDEDTDKDELIQMQRAAAAFLKQEAVREAITALLQGEQLDPAVLAQAWRNVQDAPALPEGFSWPKISKGFSRKAKEIRDSIPELKAIFVQNLAIKADEALASSIGPQPDLDLDRYSKALLKEFGRLNLDCLDTDGATYNNFRLWSVFVPQSVRECEKFQPRHLEQPKGEEERQEQLRPYYEQQPRSVLEVCADQQLQRLVILGDPGSGKSTLLRCLALEWARDENATRRATAPLPLLIELRDYNQWECPSGKSFTAYLHLARNWHRLNQQHLNELLQTPGRVLLLLDGLDEIFDPQQRELAVNDIFRFSNDYPDARIVLTSRVVGYKPERLRDAGFRHFKLEDFDEEQIEEFLTLWHQITFSDQEEAERKRQRLAKAIADSRPIKLLAGNPLLLTLMAVINRNQELPRNRARLYEKAAELLLQQWDTERHLRDFPGLSAEIDLRAKTAILRKVALEMQTAWIEAANLIQGEKLIKLIEDYLLTELRFTQARAAAKALVDQLRQRNFILCFLGGDSYGFVHRTFLEYFCAAEYVHQFEKKRSLDIDGLLALYDQHCRKDDWQEVLRLICGQLEEHKVNDEWIVGKIIKHLTELVDLKKWDKETELPELVLATYCLGEIKNLNRVSEENGKELLEKVISCILNTKNDYDPQKLFYAGKTVAVSWPGKSFFKFTGQYPTGSIYSLYCWPHFLAAVFRKRLWVEQLVWKSDIVSVFRERIIRNQALKSLLIYWKDDDTLKMIKKISSIDGEMSSLYGKEHSNFGKFAWGDYKATIWKQDENNWQEYKEYRDPRQPIPAEHIQKAAKKAGIPPDKIDEAVRSLSAHMGWDITKGSLAGKL